MTYHDFLSRVTHDGKIDIVVTSVLDSRGPHRHELALIKEGAEIEGAEIEPEGYAYYIITLQDGTIFIVRDVIADENNFTIAY